MLLVITATAREAAPLRTAIAGSAGERHGVPVVDGDVERVRVRLAVTGVARANTAFSLSRLLLDHPAAVLQVGVGGAFDPDALALTDVACATSDVYADLGTRTETGWLDAEELALPIVERGRDRWFAELPCDPAATRAVADHLGVTTGPFATVETVTGTERVARELRDRTTAIVESMEGAAAAHACLLARVPFVQLRAVSNIVGPRDPAAWRLDDAVGAAGAAALEALPVLAQQAR